MQCVRGVCRICACWALGASSGISPHHYARVDSLRSRLALDLPYCGLDCLGPSWPGSSSRGACRVRATILLRLPPDCWLFIQEMRSAPVAEPLSGDIQTILDLAPRIELRPPIPEARFVASMSRLQVEALHRWLHALLDELSPDDPRWPTCLQCIGRVAGSLRLSQP
jgi:hypothetical protein